MSQSLLPSSYENITLASLNGDLSVVLYLPYGSRLRTGTSTSTSNATTVSSRDTNYYYYGSRFDHGSMIGSITTKRRRRQRRRTRTKPTGVVRSREQDPDNNDHDHDHDHDHDADEVEEIHELFGTDLWRLPHNGHWPESGIGLASEFGVGDDGSMCTMKCGYPLTSNGITNGLLGYESVDTTNKNKNRNDNDNDDDDENDDSDTFLKIGVGVLIKGTCPACDSSNEYKFNSPYLFAQIPKWTIQETTRIVNGIKIPMIVLDHEATIRNHYKNHNHNHNHDNDNDKKKRRIVRYGYKIHKEIYIHPNNSSLIVTTQLYNIGTSPVMATSAVENTNDNNSNNNENDSNNDIPDTSSSSGSNSDSGAFSTVWYSHNLFTCDHQPIGPGYDVDLNIAGDAILATAAQSPPPPRQQQQEGVTVLPPDAATAATTPQQEQHDQSYLYDEPTTWSWSKPIAEYSTIQSFPNSIHVHMTRPLEPGERIKTEFKNDDFNNNDNEDNTNTNGDRMQQQQEKQQQQQRGGFTIIACDTMIESTLSWPEQYNTAVIHPNPTDDINELQQPTPQPQTQQPTIEMYAYNLYIERGTFSPEPQLLFSNIHPGAFVEWTQTISVRSNAQDENDDGDETILEDEWTDAIVNQQQQQLPLLPTAWLTNLLPGYKKPGTTTMTSTISPIWSKSDSNNAIVTVLSNTISFVMIVSTLFLVTMMVTYPIRRRRRRQQQYESIT